MNTNLNLTNEPSRTLDVFKEEISRTTLKFKYNNVTTIRYLIKFVSNSIYERNCMRSKMISILNPINAIANV